MLCLRHAVLNCTQVLQLISRRAADARHVCNTLHAVDIQIQFGNRKMMASAPVNLALCYFLELRTGKTQGVVEERLVKL